MFGRVDSGMKMKQRSAMTEKFEIDDIDKSIIGELESPNTELKSANSKLKEQQTQQMLCFHVL